MDFNRVQQVTDTRSKAAWCAPPRPAPRTSRAREAKDGQVTVANELPGGAQGGNNNAEQREQTQRSEEITNFEISKTTKTRRSRRRPRVKKLSVAVLVDGIYTRLRVLRRICRAPPRSWSASPPSCAGHRFRSQPRRSGRGDQPQACRRPARDRQRPAEPLPSRCSLTREDVLHFIELAVFAILTLLVVLLVVRPLMRAMGIGAAKRAAMLPARFPAFRARSRLGMVGGQAALPGPGQEGMMQAANSTPPRRMRPAFRLPCIRARSIASARSCR